MEPYEYPNFTVQQIALFTKVVDEGGFGKAGLAMHMSQPAVSKSIAKLEKNLNILLFERTTRQLRLTDEGKRLYELWTKHLHELTTEILNIRNDKTIEGNVINIAITNTTLAGKYLWEYVEKFQQEYPQIQFNFDSDSMHVISAKLIDGDYDIVIVPDFQQPMLEENGLSWKWVKQSSAQLLIPNSNPLSKREYLTMEDILDETFVTLNPDETPYYNESLLALFKPYNRQPNISTIYRSDYAVKSVYRGLDGIFVTDDFFDYDATSKIAKVPLKDHKNGMICAWNKRARNKYVKYFLDMLGN